MHLREYKEQREDRDLAPYAMRSQNSRGRKYPESEDNYRTIYERDRDRIIHTTAFRRLEYKTQVFVNFEGDLYRTRLTHSIETMQVARSLAGALSINETLAETLGLAHDLGHPPFGHAGEDTLHRLMKGHGGFAHNRQVLRIVDLLEKRSPAYDGLNLSYEVRECLLKSEKRIAPEAAEFDKTKQYLLEEQVVDLADSTAYNHHDLDDGLRSGILNEDLLDSLKLWQRSRKDAESNYKGLKGNLRLRRIMNSLIGISIHDLIDHSIEQIKKNRILSVADVRNCKTPLVGHSPEIRKEVQELHKFLFKNFYRHPRVAVKISLSDQTLTALFKAYTSSPKLLPKQWQTWCDKVGLQRGTCDYIAGMTDRFALDESRRIADL